MGMEVGEPTYVSVEELYRLDPAETPLRIVAAG